MNELKHILKEYEDWKKRFVKIFKNTPKLKPKNAIKLFSNNDKEYYLNDGFDEFYFSEAYEYKNLLIVFLICQNYDFFVSEDKEYLELKKENNYFYFSLNTGKIFKRKETVIEKRLLKNKAIIDEDGIKPTYKNYIKYKHLFEYL